jgi:hypothetical protein
MNPEVMHAEALANHKLRIRFSNNEEKEFDVSPYLDKGIFTELKDETYFKSVRVAFGAVEWPNEQDFSKDTLYILGKPAST